MGLPVNFVRNIPRIRSIINNFHFHDEVESALNIDYLIEGLKINIEEKVFKDPSMQGYSIRPTLPAVRPQMFINKDKPIKVQRKTKGHELGHILFHYKELPLCSHIGQENKLLEREANYYSAYFLIPTKTIYLAKKWKVSNQELSDRMVVQIDMTDYRYEIYLGLKEYEFF